MRWLKIDLTRLKYDAASLTNSLSLIWMIRRCGNKYSCGLMLIIIIIIKIAPSMWKAHMTLHVQGVFSGDVPNFWLEENDVSICHLCHQLVSNNQLSSHPRKCAGSAVVAPVLDSVLGDVPHNLAEMSLPTFEDVCLLDQPTLRFIPSKSRPAFAGHCHLL